MRTMRTAVSSTRQLGDVDHGTAEPPVDRLRLGELVVHLDEAGVALPVRLHQPCALAADVGEPLRRDRQTDDLGGVDAEELVRRMRFP